MDRDLSLVRHRQLVPSMSSVAGRPGNAPGAGAADCALPATRRCRLCCHPSGVYLCVGGNTATCSVSFGGSLRRLTCAWLLGCDLHSAHAVHAALQASHLHCRAECRRGRPPLRPCQSRPTRLA